MAFEPSPGSGSPIKPWWWDEPDPVAVPQTVSPEPWYGGGRSGGGGSGGGGRVQMPQLEPWEGAIPAGPWYGMPSALPWGQWQDTPWANVPRGRSQEAMAWMNTALPWYQQQMAWNQFAQQMDWNQERFGREADLQRELANVSAFGRRQTPNARWL